MEGEIRLLDDTLFFAAGGQEANEDTDEAADATIRNERRGLRDVMIELL